MSALDEAEKLVEELQELHASTRVRADQIAIAVSYWRAVRIATELRTEPASV